MELKITKLAFTLYQKMNLPQRNIWSFWTQTKTDVKRNLVLKSELLSEQECPVVLNSAISWHPINDTFTVVRYKLVLWNYTHAIFNKSKIQYRICNVFSFFLYFIYKISDICIRFFVYIFWGRLRQLFSLNCRCHFYSQKPRASSISNDPWPFRIEKFEWIIKCL